MKRIPYIFYLCLSEIVFYLNINIEHVHIMMVMNQKYLCVSWLRLNWLLWWFSSVMTCTLLICVYISVTWTGHFSQRTASNLTWFEKWKMFFYIYIYIFKRTSYSVIFSCSYRWLSVIIIRSFGCLGFLNECMFLLKCQELLFYLFCQCRRDADLESVGL